MLKQQSFKIFLVHRVLWSYASHTVQAQWTRKRTSLIGLKHHGAKTSIFCFAHVLDYISSPTIATSSSSTTSPPPPTTTTTTAPVSKAATAQEASPQISLSDISATTPSTTTTMSNQSYQTTVSPASSSGTGFLHYFEKLYGLYLSFLKHLFSFYRAAWNADAV